MAALLMGKALVAKNPQIHNNLWKPDVIKPFPSRFLKNSNLNLRHEPLIETKLGAPSTRSMFCNTSSTMLFAPLQSTATRSFSVERNDEMPSEKPKFLRIYANTFDIVQMETQDIETSPKGNSFVPITYGGNSNLRIETPVLRAPFGVRRFSSSNGREEAALSVAFDDSEISQKMLSIVKSIEQKVVDTALDRAESWFAEWPDRTEAKIRAAFRSALRPPRDPKLQPLWRLKLKTNSMRPTDFFYNGERTAEDEVLPFSKVVAYAELRGIWILADTFGTTWSLLSCKIEEVGKPREKRFEETNESQ